MNESSIKYPGLLKPDSQKFLIAMAEAELDPVELAQKAGLSNNIVYSMRKGIYTKPKYIGKAAKVLNKTVLELVEAAQPGD